MTSTRLSLFASIALLVAAMPLSRAEAVINAVALPSDSRIRQVVYQPDQVYRFLGMYGLQSAIEFEKDEEIRTISMGDSTAWMMNPSGFRLFLKPLEQDATTNMTLITNKRTYLFELHAREAESIEDPELTFIMRFVYQDANEGSMQSVTNYLDAVPLPDIEENPGKYNFNYTIAGTDEIAPLRIFDDGEFTYFEFRDKNAEVPAFYWVDEQGNESLINYRARGNFIVVERVSKKFTLRHGAYVICVFNEGYSLLTSKQPAVDKK